MLKSAKEIIRALNPKQIKDSLNNKFLPFIGSLIGEGIDIAEKIGIPNSFYASGIDRAIKGIHKVREKPIESTIGVLRDVLGTFRSPKIYETRSSGEIEQPFYRPHHKSAYERMYSTQKISPSQNAAYGIGNLGPVELAPAFVGDRQEIDEGYEIIGTPMTNKYNIKKRITYEKLPKQKLVKKRVTRQPKKKTRRIIPVTRGRRRIRRPTKQLTRRKKYNVVI